MYVKPKKELGQHFLKDLSIAQRIAELLTVHPGVDGVPYTKSSRNWAGNGCFDPVSAPE